MFNLMNMQNLLFYTLSFTLMLTSACSNQATNKNKDQSPQAILGKKIITDKPVTPTEKTATSTQTPATPPTQPVSACPKDNNFELCRYKELKAGTMNATHVSTHICTHSQIGMHIILRANQYEEFPSPSNALACDLISYDVRTTDGIIIDLPNDTIVTFILPTLHLTRIHALVDITQKIPCRHRNLNMKFCSDPDNSESSMVIQNPPLLLHSEVKVFSDLDSAFCTEQAEEKVGILTSNGYACTIQL